jgi:hypothetical protein
MTIQIELHDNDLESKLSKQFLKQYPFAASRALTKVAFAARADVISHIQSDLHNTTNFLKNSTQVEMAKKSNLQSEIGLLERVKFGERLVEGGTRTPITASNIAVPINAGRGKTGRVTKANKPAALLNKKGYFFKEINGVKGIWKKLKGGGIQLMYDFEKSTEYDEAPYLDFFRIVEDSASRHDFEQMMQDALLQAIK